MNAYELVDLTNKRIDSLTLSELVEAITALEDNNLLAGDLLEVIRRRDYEAIGHILMICISSHHENDIVIHEGL